ncbi:MAG: hypothetical protein AAGI88_17670 [Pseudomonadota bacterium]
MKQQQKLKEALDDYFDVCVALQADLQDLLNTETASAAWRRNFVRVSMTVLEGHAQSFRRLCSVALECDSPELTRKEVLLLRKERAFSVNERLKLTLNVAYKLFELEPASGLDGHEYFAALRLMKKRQEILQPKVLRDLDLGEDTWVEVYESTKWLLGLFDGFSCALRESVGR